MAGPSITGRRLVICPPGAGGFTRLPPTSCPGAPLDGRRHRPRPRGRHTPPTLLAPCSRGHRPQLWRLTARYPRSRGTQRRGDSLHGLTYTSPSRCLLAAIQARQGATVATAPRYDLPGKAQRWPCRELAPWDELGRICLTSCVSHTRSTRCTRHSV